MSLATLAARRSARSPALHDKLRQMSLRLHPLVNVCTGVSHPAFPSNLLQFWLLTDDQLESLASFYHQRTPQVFSRLYPCPIAWPRHGLALEDKRRKFGRFIGLRGCDSPVRQPLRPTRSRTPRRRTCAGTCRLVWDTRRLLTRNKPTCMDCSLRTIKAIIKVGTASAGPSTRNGASEPDLLDSSGEPMEFEIYRDNVEDDTGAEALSIDDMTVPTTTTDPKVATNKGADHPAPPQPRPGAATTTSYPLRPRVAASSGRIQHRSPAPSPPPRRMPLTVDEIIEEAQRARLAADAGDEAMRNKVGHY